MLVVTSIMGNIFEDEKFKSVDCERITVLRSEMEKRRMRVRTNTGTDVGVSLDSGVVLRHGDVLAGDGRLVVVEQAPEKVISLKLRQGAPAELPVLAGHIIGNRHRPITVDDGRVLFPIQADSELQVFERLFAGIADDVEMSIEEIIFQPHTGAGVHGHA